jgi:hypothetical protein
MDMMEYALITDAAHDRLDDLRRDRPGDESGRAVSSGAGRLARVLYIASALRARPRTIDRHIDYFGDRAVCPR